MCALVTAEFLPHEALVERLDAVPDELFRDIQRKAIMQGYYALNMPQEHGGGGSEFALAANMVICAPHVEFALPELQRGIIPEAGGLWRALRRLPRNIACELLLTGRHLGAEEGLRLGFVNRIVPRSELTAAARATAT